MMRRQSTRFRARTAIVLAIMVAVPVFARAADDTALCVERGQFRQAEPLLVARVAKSPIDLEAILLLSQVRREQGRLDDALKLAEHAVVLAPNDAQAHYRLAEVCGLKAQKAGMLKAAGLAKRFKREIDTALALAPEFTDAIEASIEFHHQAPGIMGGDKKKIPMLIDRLVALDPARGWAKRGRFAIQLRDSVAAEAHYRKAVAAETDGVLVRLAMARLLSPQFRNPAQSEKLALEAAARAPWRQDAWGIAAAVQAIDGRLDEAQATLARAELADPLRAGSAYIVARSLLRDGRNLEFAEAQVRRYLAHDPEYGWPSHADAHATLALLLERQGRTPEAIAALQTALRLEPGLEQAKKDLKRLKG